MKPVFNMHRPYLLIHYMLSNNNSNIYYKKKNKDKQMSHN